MVVFLLIILLIVVILLVSSSRKKSKLEIKKLETEISQPKEKPKPNVADDLIKLKTLLDQNVITQEEFEQEKKKLLNS